VWPGFLRFKVLFMGLPVSSGRNHLRIRGGADAPAVIAAIDRVLRQLAKRTRASAIVLKEFGDDETAALAHLRPRGYAHAPSLPMNVLDVRYRDFEDFVASRSGHARSNLRHSLRKFADSGIHIEHLPGSPEVADRFSNQVYHLYENVWDRAANRLEKLSPEFFRELARQMGSHVLFTFATHEGEIVAFACSLHTATCYQMLFMGIDYELNRQTDLYFNIFYREMDWAMQRGVQTILMGQTADDFKSRLRCQQRPLHFYVRMQGLLRVCHGPLGRLLFPGYG
jgi:predicted N-acyltransferase